MCFRFLLDRVTGAWGGYGVFFRVSVVYVIFRAIVILVCIFEKYDICFGVKYKVYFFFRKER